MKYLVFVRRVKIFEFKMACLIGSMVMKGEKPYFSENAYIFVVFKLKEIGLWSGITLVRLLCLE